MKKLAVAVVIINAVGFSCLGAFITWFGLQDETPKSDLIVVLGNEVHRDGSLSPRLQGRMNRAIELFKEGKGKMLFVSGATGMSGVDESVAMKAYALSSGLKENEVVADAFGVNTRATAKNAAAFLSTRKWNSAILVSQFFHLARTDFAFRKQGITQLGHAHARYFEWRDVYSLLRECVALPVYWLRS